MVVLFHPTLARAHEDGTLGIELPVERIAPGDELPIIGADWAARAPLEVWLQPVGQPRIRLGSVITGADGHFLAKFVIPVSVPPGPAALEVISTYGVRDTGVLMIDPAAPPASSLIGTTSAGSPTDVIDPFPLIALGGAIAALLLLVTRTRGRRAGA